jgi:hypothetical protein
MCSLVIPTWRAEIMKLLEDRLFVFAHESEDFVGIQELLLVLKTIVYEWEVSLSYECYERMSIEYLVDTNGVTRQRLLS